MRGFNAQLIIQVILLTFLVGCNYVPVAEDLSQRQANEVIAALNDRGIGSYAERGTGSRANYKVEVKRGFYSQAKSVLFELQLPSEDKLTFADLTTQKGLVPNSREIESLRVDRALAVQVEDLLNAISQVQEARVVVRAKSLETGQSPSVSVVIKERKGTVVDPAEVVRIVSKTVPGINIDQISLYKAQQYDSKVVVSDSGVYNAAGKVVAVPLTPFLHSYRVPEGDYNGLAITFAAFLVLTGAIGFLVGRWLGLVKDAEKREVSRLPTISTRTFAVDRERDSSEA